MTKRNSLGRSFYKVLNVIEGVRTVLLTFMSLFYSPLTVDDVMSVVNDTISNTCFEVYPILIFNDTRMVAVVCLLGLAIAIILGALLFLGLLLSTIIVLRLKEITERNNLELRNLIKGTLDSISPPLDIS